MHPILEIVSALGLSESDVRCYGQEAAKLRPATLARLGTAPSKGRLILVSAMTPTPAGEGKTTVSIALAQGLRRLGRKSALALREPSMGPVFGQKGGGTGGGNSQLVPSAAINLHFTGDLHAVAAANNLLAAIADNALHFGAPNAPDARRVSWRRVLDMNDRALREVVIGLGGRLGGVPREAAFDITAASEIMALLCLAKNVTDLKERLARVVVGEDSQGRPVTAKALEADGAMGALLHEAFLPNVAQSTEGVPAFVHGGPFANIAHGCSSVLGTKSALALCEDVVTEAGFAFDLGGEKFFDLKCRDSGLWPRAVVLVATVRALRHLGGDQAQSATGPALEKALQLGLKNVQRHVANVRRFGFEPVIALNVFSQDSKEDLERVLSMCKDTGLRAERCDGFACGGEGAEALAKLVHAAANEPAPAPRFMYPLEAPLMEKLRLVATQIYGAADVELSAEAAAQAQRITELGGANLPVCVAKTQYSFSDDPKAGGDPAPFPLRVRGLQLRAGAGFVLALAGEMQTMPGLPKKPAAHRIRLSDAGEVEGVS